MVDPDASLGTELNRLADAASDGTLERGDSLTLYQPHSGARVFATISLEADE